jgi:SAM-dependent methyltransferase
LATPELTEPRRAWDREYAEVRAYTTSYRGDLDRGVRFLLDFLDTRSERIDGPIVDCGCGMGRNAIALARMGYEVVGLEHSAAALGRLDEVLGGEKLSGSLTTIRHDLNKPLPVDDGFAAAVLDITAVDNLVDADRRRAYGLEVSRILRPGGIAVVVTFARDDGYYGPWLENSPWRDTGVVEDPHTGIRNKLFTPAELDAVFAPPLVREAAATLVFIDEAAKERWTRRFLCHLYRA